MKSIVCIRIQAICSLMKNSKHLKRNLEMTMLTDSEAGQTVLV
nr:MAG TPA: APC repeat containing protein [Caudoviricetes sp.]